MSRSAPRLPTPVLPVPLVRDALAREVARQSLRRVAREVGISPNGLRNFLRGSDPRPATRGKLEHWLAVRRGPTRPPSVGHLVRLLDELGADLAPRQAAALGREIAQSLATAYERRHQPPPRWVRELITHYRDQPPSGA